MPADPFRDFAPPPADPFWLLRLIRLGIERRACIDTGCSTCGGRWFRAALRREAFRLGGRAPQKSLDRAAARHLAVALADLRPEAGEEGPVAEAVELALRELHASPLGGPALEALLEGSWARRLRGRSHRPTPEQGCGEPPEPQGSRGTRAPLYTLYLAAPEGEGFTAARKEEAMEVMGAGFPSFTMIPATGVHEGRRLETLLIQIAAEDRSAVAATAAALARRSGQRWVGMSDGALYRSVPAELPEEG